MLQSKLSTKNPATVGEEISHELGAKMVKDFQDAHPEDVTANYIGRNILESILSQPGCAGIRFYNAINETGIKTLVYVGVDMNEKLITAYTGVNNSGELINIQGIVADRSSRPGSEDSDSSSESDSQSWDWFA